MKRLFLILSILSLLVVGCGGSTVPPQEDVPPEVEVPWDVVKDYEVLKKETKYVPYLESNMNNLYVLIDSSKVGMRGEICEQIKADECGSYCNIWAFDDERAFELEQKDEATGDSTEQDTIYIEEHTVFFKSFDVDECPKDSSQSTKSTATRIIDGDTFELGSNLGKVRMICIDTPERGEELYEEAGDYLSELILNKEVILEKDISDTDRYDRLLRYVWIGDKSINAEMVRSGYARVYRYEPDVKYCDEYDLLEVQAKEEGLGIWAASETEEVSAPMPAVDSPDTPEMIVGSDACSSDTYNCGDFSTYSQAYKVFSACPTDVHKLDRDGDGIPCESLK